MKDSQSYPPDFGTAIINVIHKCQQRTLDDALQLRNHALAVVHDVPLAVFGDPDLTWGDADLAGVFEFLLGDDDLSG